MQRKFDVSVKQLYLLIFITAASLTGLGLYGISGYKKLNENTRTLYADRVVCMRQLANMRFQYAGEIVPAALSVKNHLLTFDAAWQRVRNARLIIDSNWRNYKLTYLTPEENLLAKQTDTLKQQVDQDIKTLESVLLKKDTAAIADLAKRQAPAVQMPFSIKLTQLMDLQERVGKQIFENSSHTYTAASKNFTFWILFSLLIAIPLSFLIIKNIRRLIKDILESHDNIKTSENKYRSVLENASDAIYLADNTGNFIDLSNSMCKMLGYSKEELLPLNFSDIVDPESLKSNPIERPAVPNQPIFKERTFITKEGEKIAVEIHGQRVSENTLMGVARDVTERKKMETELREAELKFRTVAEKSMLGVYITQNRRFLYVNPRFAEIFGYTCQELMDLSGGIIDTIYAEESRAMIREKIRARDNGETEGAHYEAIGLKKDGSMTHVEFYGNRVMINGQPAAIGTALDITERKRMEIELKDAELKFRTLVERSMVGVYISQNERYLYVNPRFAEIFGYEQEELIDRPDSIIEKLFDKESLDTIRANIKARYSGEVDSVRYQVAGKRKDGSRNELEIFGNIVTINDQRIIIGTLLDITERKQAQELILKEKELSDTIINSLPGIFYLRDENGRGVRWNKNLETVTGYSPEEIEGAVLRNFIAEEDQEKMRTATETTFNEGYASAEVKVVTKDGRKIPYLLTGKPVNYENHLCLLGTGIDISQRIKADEELRLSEQNLARYNRELTLLNKINDIILRIRDEIDLYKEVCNCIATSGGYKLAWICHKPDTGADQMLVPLAFSGAGDYLKEVKIALDDPKLSKGPTATALLTLKTFVNNNVNAIAYFGPWLETARKYGLSSSLALPLDLGHEKTGVLTIYSGDVDAFDEHEVSVLERMAANVSIAIQNIRTENELTESESRFRGAFENASIGVGLVSLKGEWLQVNRTLCTMLGYNEDELLELTFQQITHPDDIEGNVEFLSQMMNGETDNYRVEKRYIRKGGSVIWANLNVSLIRGQDKQPLYFLSVIENITEKVESQLKFQNLVENFIVGVYIHQHGKIVYINPRLLEESGYAEEDLIGRPFEEFIYKDDLKLVQHITEKREKGQIDTVRYEARFIKKDGRPIWFEIFGSRTVYQGAPALMGTMVNVSERKAVYDELKKSEANLLSIFDSTDVSYLLLDAKYNIVALNKHMRDIYLSQTGVMLFEGDNLIEVIIPEKRQQALEMYDKVLHSKESCSYETSYTNAGVTRHFSASILPITVGAEVVVLCISSIDITEQKNALEKLREANERLLKKTKQLEFSNAELEQFAYVASHDLQEPLRMVTSFLSLIEQRYNAVLDDKGKKYIYFASDGAKRMRQLILDLLEFSRVGRIENRAELVDFNQLINEILTLHRKTIEDTNAIIEIGKLPAFYVHKTPVRQVLQNLIGNSLKYHKARVPPVIAITCIETRKEFEFSVKDNGIGIDSEYFDKIFIIFKRLHNREEYSGTGMGLAIAKKIVENLGGRIWVNSEEGKGSDFRFTLPKKPIYEIN